MSKAERKAITDGNEQSNDNKTVRRKIGAQVKMDIQPYIDLYPNKKLMIINDLDGDVQRWLDAGAEPIPAVIQGRKIYEGLNDKAGSQWVKFVAGQAANGETYYAYGLMMDKDLYDDYKHAPQRQRQADIRNAMEQGVSDSSASLKSGQNIGSYAPNLPTGAGQGYNEIKAK